LKLLVVASSLDLRTPLGVTPSLWQLLKALAQEGVDLVVAPYQGPAIESPWWTAAANPCQTEGAAVALVKQLAPARPMSSAPRSADSISDRLTIRLVERVTRPRWRRHLLRLLHGAGDFDAVLFACVPPNHFAGLADEITHRFGLPVVLYDGDVPASLPRFAGFRTGFRIYQGIGLDEYGAVLSSSRGGIADLQHLGARNVHSFYYAADPELFAPMRVDQDLDVFFYGLGREYRADWIDAMLAVPSQQMADARFAVRGSRLGRMPAVRQLPYASFSALKRYCSRSRLNLLITRQTHALVYASSTARPFELAALGCAMVSNPYLGIEEWFEPGREVVVVHDPSEVVATYRELLANPNLRQDLGTRARARLLDEHTYAHRARQLHGIIQSLD
jgi:glycosyltransferase involved in cell wall biosynthesis